MPPVTRSPIEQIAALGYASARSVGRVARFGLLKLVAGIERMGGVQRMAAGDGNSPFDIVSPGTIDAIYCDLANNPNSLLEIRHVRQTLTNARLLKLLNKRGIQKVDGVSAQIAHDTVDYNIESAKTGAALDRPSVMVNVVRSIERVWLNIENLDVLSIGPRSEIEIFAILAAGFSASRLRAVDLFSYSPYVQIGDMHKLSFPGNSFDVVFLGWVLSYSRDQVAVAREILRVCRDRAIVVLAGDYSDDTRDRPTFRNETTHMRNCGQLLDLFDGRVGQVFFRHDPDPPNTSMVMTAFEVRK